MSTDEGLELNRGVCARFLGWRWGTNRKGYQGWMCHGFGEPFVKPGEHWNGEWVNPWTPDYFGSMELAADLVSLMQAQGSSFTLNWGEDNDQWECSWITSGTRYTAFGGTMQAAISRVALKAGKHSDPWIDAQGQETR
jgi:hypothetical protein